MHCYRNPLLLPVAHCSTLKCYLKDAAQLLMLVNNSLSESKTIESQYTSPHIIIAHFSIYAMFTMNVTATQDTYVALKHSVNTFLNEIEI